MERLLKRAGELGAKEPGHYLVPGRVSGKTYDPTQPPSQWAWRKAWRKLTEAAGLKELRLHDLRHHAITRLAESNAASEETIMAIAGHVSREMLQHYSHIRQEAKRKAVTALDNVTITAHLAQWQAEAEEREKQNTKKSKNLMVGAEGFEPTTLCSQSRCATRLRYAPIPLSIVTRMVFPGRLPRPGLRARIWIISRQIWPPRPSSSDSHRCYNR
jgi:hypothetical protein